MHTNLVCYKDLITFLSDKRFGLDDEQKRIEQEAEWRPIGLSCGNLRFISCVLVNMWFSDVVVISTV